MSVPQGSTAFNEDYFVGVEATVSVTVTCAELQRISTQVNASVNGTLTAVNSQLSAVQSDYAQLAQRIATLDAHIATMVASQAAFVGVETQAALVSAAIDLPSVIVYLNAQAVAHIALGIAGNASFLMQALKLAQELDEVVIAYNKLEKQIESLTALLTGIPTRLAHLVSVIEAQAATIPSCTIT